MEGEATLPVLAHTLALSLARRETVSAFTGLGCQVALFFLFSISFQWPSLPVLFIEQGKPWLGARVVDYSKKIKCGFFPLIIIIITIIMILNRRRRVEGTHQGLA